VPGLAAQDSLLVAASAGISQDDSSAI